MKKKIIIAFVVVLLLILFVPIPTGVLKDGGTRVYSALTYKIVDWNHIYGYGEIYSKTKIYPFPTNFLSIDSLLAKEEKHFKYDITDSGLHGTTENPLVISYGFECQYIRTDGFPDGVEYPLVKIIRSEDELKTYYENNKDVYSLGSRENVASDSTIGFVDACKEYDTEFFKDRNLLIVVLEEGSGSIRHLVDKVSTTSYKGNHRADVEIFRKVPEAGTCDMAVWHILIDITKDFACTDENNVRVFVDGALKSRNTTTIKYSKNYANISLKLIDGWEYEIVENTDSTDFDVVVYPKENKNEYITFKHGMFGYCGTGLKLKNSYVGRYRAKEGTYSTNKYWDFLELQNTAGRYIVINGCSTEFYSKNEHEIASMLESLEVGRGCVSEVLAVETAKKFATIDYDTIRAEFDSKNGVWQITFTQSKTNDTEIVNIRYDGTSD